MDKIFVRSCDDMEKIIAWANAYVANNDTSDCRIPFESVEVQLHGEDLNFTMKSCGDMEYELTVYVPTGSGMTPTCGCKVLFANGISHYSVSSTWYGGNNEHDRRMMRTICTNARIIEKQMLKFVSLMVLAVYYHPVFATKCVESRTKKPTKKTNRKKTAKYLVTKKYVLDSDATGNISIPKTPRKKCDHEFGVRGHFRTLKSGRKVWVKAYRKNAGMTAKDKNYIV